MDQPTSRPVPARWILQALTLAALLALACNAPQYFGVTNATAPPPPPTSTPGGAVGGPTAAASATPGAESTRIPLPTFTPIRSTRTPLAGTSAPPGTPAPEETATLTPTPTATTSGPLRFAYELTWELDPEDAARAIATVRISAAGGSGDYRYFHDDLPVAGSTFTFRWTACHAKPGSLRVDSGAESTRVNYYAVPPCP